MFRYWEELTPLEQAAATWWDMYKDAYGIRPRGIDTSGWTLEDFRREMRLLEGAFAPPTTYTERTGTEMSKQSWNFDDWWENHGKHNVGPAATITKNRVRELMKLAFEVAREGFISLEELDSAEKAKGAESDEFDKLAAL